MMRIQVYVTDKVWELLRKEAEARGPYSVNGKEIASDILDRWSKQGQSAQPEAAERQAAALERIATRLELITGTWEGDGYIRTSEQAR